MEQKQMIMFLVIGVLIGAIGVYGAAMTGYIPVHVEKEAAEAAGVPYAKALGVQMENFAKDVAKEYALLGQDVRVLTSVVKTHDGQFSSALKAHVICLNELGKVDLDLSEEVIQKFNEKFSDNILLNEIFLEQDALKATAHIFAQGIEGQAALGFDSSQIDVMRAVGVRALEDTVITLRQVFKKIKSSK